MAKPSIRIEYSKQWDEYRVIVSGRPDLTYHTDDKDDAKETKQAMIQHFIDRSADTNDTI